MTVIDISSNNSVPDFHAVKAAGVEGVIIKATEGLSYTNPRFVHDWALAHAAGLRVGSYHYSHQDLRPTMAGARAEANHYLATMAHLPGHGHAYWLKGDFIPILDFEVGTPDGKYSPWRDTFFDEIHRHSGHYSMLYTFPGFNDWAKPSKPNSKLWIANYGVSKPSLPGGYGDFTGWQFTDREHVPGCHEPVDASKFAALPLCRHDG